MPGEFKDINGTEVIATVVASASLGIVRLLYLIRKGREFKYVDLILEPCLAVFGGMLFWATSEVTQANDILQAVLTSLGAWGGPRTIHWAEKKYLGGSRNTDSVPLDTPSTKP